VNWVSVGSVNNDLSGHELLAVTNRRAVLLTMSGSWWGDGRGPRRSTAPAATGDSVDTQVSVGTLRTTPFNPGTQAAGLHVVRGDGQSAPRRAALSQPFTVRVVDDTGRPVAGTTVTFAVTENSGTLSTQTAVSDASGLAESTLTLGSTGGQNTVRATILGGTVTVTFIATGT
jgi:hypothetical protein